MAPTTRASTGSTGPATRSSSREKLTPAKAGAGVARASSSKTNNAAVKLRLTKANTGKKQINQQN